MSFEENNIAVVAKIIATIIVVITSKVTFLPIFLLLKAIVKPNVLFRLKPFFFRSLFLPFVYENILLLPIFDGFLLFGCYFLVFFDL